MCGCLWAWTLIHADPSLAFSENLLIARSSTALPQAHPHPLPPTLATWHDDRNSGDYFDQVKPVSVEYLVWSRLPIAVYVEPLKSIDSSNAFSRQQSQEWVKAVENAVREWNQYLPLKIVPQAQEADIVIWRSAPPLRLERDSPESSSGNRRPAGLVLGRARSAETRFELYTRPASSQPNSLPVLAHRFTILLRPDQAPQYLQAAARHELGHALGIWGHSPRETDALYFSQVRNPPAISSRDVNTLKRIYQQPTRLGWALPE